MNSKGKINPATVECAKPQKSLTLARNAQRSHSSSSTYIFFYFSRSTVPSQFAFVFSDGFVKSLSFFSFVHLCIHKLFPSTCSFPRPKRNQAPPSYLCLFSVSLCDVSLPNLEGWFSTRKVVFDHGEQMGVSLVSHHTARSGSVTSMMIGRWQERQIN